MFINIVKSIIVVDLKRKLIDIEDRGVKKRRLVEFISLRTKLIDISAMNCKD